MNSGLSEQKSMTMSHDTDFYSWTQEQAALLRQGRVNELDVANLIEEIEDMGRSEKRELESRLAVLLMHLLKWQYQPNRRGNSWRLSIEVQRVKSRRELKQNPGLKHSLPESFSNAYIDARIQAAKETKLVKSTFPDECPWTLDQVLDDEFWPE
jgi:hypothetical protein